MREYAIALISRGTRRNMELKVRPLIPNTSDAIRYCQVDDVDLLKDLILSGKASPWDTTPDGWSLLHVRMERRMVRDDIDERTERRILLK